MIIVGVRIIKLRSLPLKYARKVKKREILFFHLALRYFFEVMERFMALLQVNFLP